MATTPQGDDEATRHSVMEAMTRAVARQQLAATRITLGEQPRRLQAALKKKKLLATYSNPVYRGQAPTYSFLNGSRAKKP